MPTTPRSVAELLTLLTSDPGRPRLTWYSGTGERVELSGAVLDNWVSKTANLLVEEFDAAPGTTVLLDLPAHWRAVVWALAVWRVGACVVVTTAGDHADPAPLGSGRDLDVPTVDLVVTDRPGVHPQARDVVAVTLAALARRFDGALPAGAVDAAAAVMTYSDRIGWTPATEPREPALLADGTTTTHSGLFAAATAPATGRTSPERVLLTGTALQTTLIQVLAVLSAAGSVVLVDDATAAALRTDSARRAALVTGERVTSDLL